MQITSFLTSLIRLLRRRKVSHMLTYKVELTGRTPFLQDAYGEPAESTQPLTEAVPKSKKTAPPREIAELACHRNDEGFIVHPATAILSLLEEAGQQIKVGRSSLKSLISKCVRMNSEWIDFYNEDGSPMTDFEVHIQYVPNSLGQKVKKIRPRFDVWVATFEIVIRDDVVNPDVIHKALTDGGEWVGLGAFRIRQKGPFGRFAVTSWAEIKDPQELQKSIAKAKALREKQIARTKQMREAVEAR